MELKTIRPPKVNVNGHGNFWKQLGMLVLGTTISLVFTLCTAQLVEKYQRAKDRRLTAMMVLSSIEQSARLLDEYAQLVSPTDSIATWLLSKPIEELELLPEEELGDLIERALPIFWMTYDKSVESVFSNNIDTWKNIENVLFIDMAGTSFTSMNSNAEYWYNYVNEIGKARDHILEHPDDYEGSTPWIKVLRNETMRQYMRSVHNNRAWFTYSAAYIRFLNHISMDAIGIPEQEVMEYTDARNPDSTVTCKLPKIANFYTLPIDPDSLTTSSFKALDARLDSLKQLK